MNLPNTRLLMYHIAAMIKLFLLVSLFFIGLALILGEPIHDSMKALLVTKGCGALSLYVAYRIFQDSSNRLNS